MVHLLAADGTSVAAGSALCRDPLASPLRMAVRSLRFTTLAWLVGVAVMAALLGSEAQLSVKSFAASSTAARVLTRIAGSAGLMRSYLGMSFDLLALLALLVEANHVVAARREEESGRPENLLTRPVSRTRWLWGRAAVAATSIPAVGLVSGAFTWLSALGQHAGLGWADGLEAGLNLVPPALVVLGFGVCVLGLAPGLAVSATYGLIAWAFLVQMVTGVQGSRSWLLDTSVLHQMAPAPAQTPDLASAGVMLGIGVLLCALGVSAFERRDLAGE